MKLIYILAGIVLLGGIGYLVWSTYSGGEEEITTTDDYRDIEYVIEGERVRLAEGELETDPTSQTITRYFGNEFMTDLDGDADEDVVFLVTQETGGSGTFYYVVAALNTELGYVGSEGLLLGDRIAPQATEKGRGNIVIINYADRAPDESFAMPPSVGKSIWLLLDPETLQFGEVEQNFEGEADSSRMSLNMKTWVFVSALYNDGREITPEEEGIFTLTFEDGNRFSATTDCNNMGGNYRTEGSTISFSEIISTKMYCEGSKESEFAELLTNTAVYSFTSRGELILDLKFDSGSAIFR